MNFKKLNSLSDIKIGSYVKYENSPTSKAIIKILGIKLYQQFGKNKVDLNVEIIYSDHGFNESNLWYISDMNLSKLYINFNDYFRKINYNFLRDE